jgi:hypothetical protein
MAMNQEFEWEHLVERYSETNLTRETDRLIALQGIANILSESRHRKSQGYHFGHWIGADDTGIMLCWMTKQYLSTLDGGGLQVCPRGVGPPSQGPKLFWRTQYKFFHPGQGRVGRHRRTEASGSGSGGVRSGFIHHPLPRRPRWVV